MFSNNSSTYLHAANQKNVITQITSESLIKNRLNLIRI